MNFFIYEVPNPTFITFFNTERISAQSSILGIIFHKRKMVINYLIPTETPCADEVGEKVLISSRFYILLHVRESLGLILWA